MVSDLLRPDPEKTLLGLRPSHAPTATPGEEPPERPRYAVVSSGHDAEDLENRGKGSDLMTAVRAGLVLLAGIILLSLLLR